MRFYVFRQGLLIFYLGFMSPGIPVSADQEAQSLPAPNLNDAATHTTAVAPTPTPSPNAWRKAARRLFGESDAVRESNIEFLRAFPDLQTRLREALKSQSARPLALDVISALRIYPLLPDLYENAKIDHTGHTYLTINELTTQSNRLEILKLYEKRIQDPKTAVPSQIVILDTLGRSSQLLPFSFLKSWLATGNHEQKSAGLTYLRRLQKSYAPEVKQDLLLSALLMASYQVQIQALHDFRGPTIGSWLCEDPKQVDLRQACAELRSEIKKQEKGK